MDETATRRKKKDKPAEGHGGMRCPETSIIKKGV